MRKIKTYRLCRNGQFLCQGAALVVTISSSIIVVMFGYGLILVDRYKQNKWLHAEGPTKLMQEKVLH